MKHCISLYFSQVALIYNEIETANVYLKQSAEIELNDLNWKEVKETTNMMQQSEVRYSFESIFIIIIIM